MKNGALIVSDRNSYHAETPDLLRKSGSISVAKRLLTMLRTAGAEPVVFVVNEREQKLLEKDISHMGATFIRTESEGSGTFNDVCIGLKYISGICENILVATSDSPVFSECIAKSLFHCGHKLAVTAFGGKPSYPVMLHREYVPLVLNHNGSRGLLGTLEGCDYKLIPVETDSGIQTRSSHENQNKRISAHHNPDRLRPIVKIQIARENIFLGPGCKQLLNTIAHTDSVQQACKQMGISYSKAWKIIRNMESELGYSVVSCKHGGKKGGESCLTSEGIELLAWFDELEKECTNTVNEIFARYYRAMPNKRFNNR